MSSSVLMRVSITPNDGVTGIETNYNPVRGIEFKHASQVRRKMRLPSNASVGDRAAKNNNCRTRLIGKHLSHTKETGSNFSKDAEL